MNSFLISNSVLEKSSEISFSSFLIFPLFQFIELLINISLRIMALVGKTWDIENSEEYLFHDSQIVVNQEVGSNNGI
ncbi:hypothetical protein AKJ41_01310 [candidate division MSBL1 archaeon SCGC-AAA259O05]|uniref:Uncharacterized protein n=1 Tax=candidate division MSBL1 archaeon SCGC-AAA259O05 TaxID=1698271 RepID=A0A133V4Z0_9EURY|nr:hypothetical protein AKJ41_01310 [candidate division MSBL1 archaeon SCGC-AAA259O05]